jgi:hypothetical protein
VTTAPGLAAALLILFHRLVTAFHQDKPLP